LSISPDLSLTLPADRGSVPEARRAIAAYGARLGIERGRIDDLKSIVTEACANVVEHAYEETGDGSIEMEASFDGQEVIVLVRDRGLGMGRGQMRKPSSLRLGLVLIGALSSSYEVSSEPGWGTALTMRLACFRRAA